VTGATRGIGRETAAALAARGADVVLAARDLAAAGRVAAEMRAALPPGAGAVLVGPRLDLSSPGSVRAFAAAYRAAGHRLDILVNNAGANSSTLPPAPGGVGGLAQLNHLGAYLLTRLLEGELQRDAARVVMVSSVVHRVGRLERHAVERSFLRAPGRGGESYAATKLANALLAAEIARRYASAGVTAAAVDPGAVASDVWRHGPFAAPPLSWMIKGLYAPPADGAAAVVHAATAEWAADAPAAFAAAARAAPAAAAAAAAAGGEPPPRFYARGLFASPLVTVTRGAPAGGAPGQRLADAVWAASAALHSAFDYNLRRLSRGRLGATTVPVPASPLAYDAALAAELWDASADAAGVPRAVGPRAARPRAAAA
jgi:NAD(P)-dependent dehydrogenase (short-subunit alcohol dehydrogenase family)